jgi:hypothetical protein
MKIRNKNENVSYIEHLESAIDEIKQAIDSITYVSYPETNRRTIDKLKKAIIVLEDMINMCIFKP